MTGALLHGLYRVAGRRSRSIIVRVVARMEGGEMRSLTLRRIFADYHDVVIGLYSYGCFRPADIPPGTRIGRYCSFASGVTVFNANHPLERPSLHPFFYNPVLGVVKRETIERRGLTVGHDVWVGRNALITPAVRNIGNGAVVGAGAVVTRDVPPYAVVAGNPARIIRFRFSEEVQQRLEHSRWWEKSIEELSLDADAFLVPAEEWCRATPVSHPCLRETVA